MYRLFNHWAAAVALTLFAACDSVEAEQPGTEQTLATLNGVLLDWNDEPVAHAGVALAINGEEVTERVLTTGGAETTRRVPTDAQGRYEVKVPVELIADALRLRQEVTLLMFAQGDDRGAAGTAEGDRIHMLPVTLHDMLDLTTIVAGAEVEVPTAYVPLQGRAYEITPELVANGGELTWQVPNPNSLGADLLEVTLVVAPDSIVVDEDDPRDEITFTVIDATRAPMHIPNGGFGVLWTLQPTSVRFDPPARLKMVGERLSMLGLADVETGTAFEVFGATLDRGWQRYGEVDVQGIDGMTMTLESERGLVPSGTWGHVLATPVADAGMLVTCQTPDGDPQTCAVVSARAIRESGVPLDDDVSVSTAQPDYAPAALHHDRLFWYSDLETRAGDCANRDPVRLWKDAQLSTGLTVVDEAGDVHVLAIPLCPHEVAERDIDLRDELVFERFKSHWQGDMSASRFPNEPRMRFSQAKVFTFDIDGPGHGCP